jgi:hypothetical protein
LRTWTTFELIDAILVVRDGVYQWRERTNLTTLKSALAEARTPGTPLHAALSAMVGRSPSVVGHSPVYDLIPPGAQWFGSEVYNTLLIVRDGVYQWREPVPTNDPEMDAHPDANQDSRVLRAMWPGNHSVSEYSVYLGAVRGAMRISVRDEHGQLTDDAVLAVLRCALQPTTTCMPSTCAPIAEQRAIAAQLDAARERPVLNRADLVAICREAAAGACGAAARMLTIAAQRARKAGG